MDTLTDLSALLVRAGAGDRGALDDALPLVYGELRSMAVRQLRGEADGHTLSPTALVHEAWLRVAGVAGANAAVPAFSGRAHFFALAASAMRRILVDHARRHRATKRDGRLARVDITDVNQLPAEERAELVVALDESLARLALLDERQARVIECRFFAGLTEEETAEALGVGLRTVKRDWAKARAWLFADLRDGPPAAPGRTAAPDSGGDGGGDAP